MAYPTNEHAGLKHILVVVAILVLGASRATSWPFVSQSSSPGTSLDSTVASAVAVLSWITSFDAHRKEKLELLVLWRGAAGWYANPSEQNRSAGGSSSTAGPTVQPMTQRLSFGTVVVTLSFDPRVRTLQIQGRDVALGTDNVVVVDNVDDMNGLHVVKTSSVAAYSSGSSLRLDDVFARSSELRAFIRCDVPLPAGALTPQASPTLCDRIRNR